MPHILLTLLQVADMVLNVTKDPRFLQGASELAVRLGQSEEVSPGRMH